MSYGAYLKKLISPLGIYALEGTFNGGELESMGLALDGAADMLEDIQREMLVSTAEGAGLERIESLLTHRPAAQTLRARQEALAALLRIGGDSFTLAAINDNLRGCGVNAAVTETEAAGQVAVHFPDVPGIPEGFDKLRRIIEDIIPCHLEIEYVYWYISWAQMEERFGTWGEIEALGLSWEGLEKLV